MRPAERIGGGAGLLPVMFGVLHVFLGGAGCFRSMDACAHAPRRPPQLHTIPGTGKTLLAKAAATETGATFIELKISDVVHGEIGESEKVSWGGLVERGSFSRPVIPVGPSPSRL